MFLASLYLLGIWSPSPACQSLALAVCTSGQWLRCLEVSLTSHNGDLLS